MPLAALNNALLLYGVGLAGTCECCAVCPPSPCVNDGDCTGSSINCVCEEGVCIPACVEGSCPVGFICVNGHCVPDPCNSEPCVSTGDCEEGCVCSQGMCLNESDQYYCCEDANGDTNCQKGPCALTDTTLGGPFNDMQLCCASGCDCRYDCNPVSNSCIPNPQGQYSDQQICLANCTDPGELGICCETMAPESNSNPSLCILRQPAGLGNTCITTRAGCQDDRPNGITRFWQRGFDNCDLCPASPTGACCKPDGCCEVLCEGECEDIGGTYMGNSWIDCDTMRDPPTIGTACDVREGCRDCSFNQPDNFHSDFQNFLMSRESYILYFHEHFHDGNLGSLKPTFQVNCLQGRKLVFYRITWSEQISLKEGLFYPTHVRRFHQRNWILGCENGNVVDLTDDALVIADVTVTPLGQNGSVIIGDTKETSYTHSRSNGEQADDGIPAHNEFDPDASNDPFTDNNTPTPAAFPGWPNIEDENLWDCP